MSSKEPEDIFFQTSSSQNELGAGNSSTDELPPRIILVCFLCFRQYDLEEDLRGHMVEYHKYKHVDKPAQEAGKNKSKDTKKKVIKVEAEEQSDKEQEQQSENVASAEMKTMPFKDFSLILRSKMSVKCKKYSSCIYKFETREKLEQHMSCHSSNNTSFQCFICSIERKNWRQCSAHLWKAHHIDVDLLKCPICKFQSHSSVLVWRHMKVHKKWRPRVLRYSNVVAPPTFKILPKKNKYYSEKTCGICERKFVNGKTLSKHIKTVHNKIKPFNCNVCGKKSARKASLIIHMRQHTGEKPLSCKSCKFSTRDPSALYKHQMKHERATKLKCSLCDYSCIQSNALKKHIRINHIDFYKKISCDLCSFVTINVNRLKAHKRDHRKGLIVNNEDSMVGQNIIKIEPTENCFFPLESVDSLPHEPAVDTGGVTIPAPSEESQFPTYLIKNHFF